MARKIRTKLIMELREQGMSRRSIAQTRRMSMESVCEVFDIAAERGIAWEDVRDVPDDDVYRLFYPDRHVREGVFEELDWGYVHKEMAKIGVNLRLLHDEHKERCRRSGKVAMGYTKFCGDYGDWTVANNLTKRIEHKAGQSCEVDWSGPTIGKGLVDPTTGEVSKVYLFVGVLPSGQKAYFEPTPDMRERTWLRCHVHMYEFWGGVPERTVCDNLKCAAAHLRLSVRTPSGTPRRPNAWSMPTNRFSWRALGKNSTQGVPQWWHTIAKHATLYLRPAQSSTFANPQSIW